MSQPRPPLVSPAPFGANMAWTDALERYRRPPSMPSPSSIRQKRPRSSAVEKSPACPATPWSWRARGSWTTAGSNRAFEDLGGGDAGAPGGRRVKGRLPHAERLVEALAREAVERLAAHPAHELREHDEARVAVAEGRRRRRLRHARGEQRHAIGEALG